VVTKDPETGWTNIGLYRRMIHDRNHTGITIIHGQHIWMHWRKNRKLGNKTMPIAVVNGWDPIMPMVACSSQSPGVCEYDIMGAIRQKPVELVKCETIDLEVPADAEIVFEGEVIIDFDQFRMEGPFGEYSGYYGSTANKKPIVRRNCITHRNDPILQGTMEGVPINEDHRMESINMSALLWEHLNSQMVGVTGVNVHPSTGWVNVFVQIDNSYIGQVQQVAFGIWGHGIGSHVGKNIIVVDRDIDIFDLNKISWAIGYRVDPKRDIHMITGSIGSTDPVKHPDERVGVTIAEGTRMLIDATKYYGHKRTEKWFGEKFAPVCYPMGVIATHIHPPTKEYVEGLYPSFVKMAGGLAAEARFLKDRPIEEVIADMDKWGIEKSVILGGDFRATNGGYVPNDHIADLVKRYPDRLIGFACVNPHGGAEAINELERAVKELGLNGLGEIDGTKQNFKPSEAWVYPLYEKCVELNIPILFHTGNSPGYPLENANPIYVDRVAHDFPKLRIAIAHFSWPWHDLAIAIAWNRPNVYIDINAIRLKYLPPHVFHYMNTVLQDKILFSHDFPALDTGKLMKELEQIPLKPETKKKMMEDNPLRFLGFD